MLLIFLLVTLVFAIEQVNCHAYFSWPTPRNQYCSDPVQCVNGGVIGAQGPVWMFNSSYSIYSGGPSVNCTTDQGQITGFQIVTTPQIRTTFVANQVYSLTVFVSETHPNNPAISTDGWQLRGRDANVPGSIFEPVALYTPWNNTLSNFPLPAQWFVLGQSIQLTVLAPATPTPNYVYQFVWLNSVLNPTGTYPGVAWLSCADVAIIGGY